MVLFIIFILFWNLLLNYFIIIKILFILIYFSLKIKKNQYKIKQNQNIFIPIIVTILQY